MRSVSRVESAVYNLKQVPQSPPSSAPSGRRAWEGGKKSPTKNAALSGVFCGAFLYHHQLQVVLSEAKDLLIYTNAAEPIRNQCLKGIHVEAQPARIPNPRHSLRAGASSFTPMPQVKARLPHTLLPPS